MGSTPRPGSAPRHPIRDALAGVPGETPSPLELVSAVVTAVAASGSTYSITVQFPDGAVIAGVPYLGWWAPRVDEVVVMLRQGPALFALGASGPSTVYAPPAPPPVPPPPPPAPPPPPSLVTRNVQPTWAGSYKPSGGQWYPGDIRQGGPNYTGLWFYGGAIAAAKGSGTIVAASIYMRRTAAAHGVNGAANVRLAVHNGAGPGQGFALTDGHVPVALLKGQDYNVPLTAMQVQRLNEGWTGLALFPGSPSFTSPDYLRVDAGPPSGALSLTIQN